MNLVILEGRLGADPEIKHLPDGSLMARASLATSERWRDDRGEAQERTEWHRLIFWGRQAEVLQEYAGKGSRLLVESGKLKTRSWEENGSKRWTTEVHVQRFTLLNYKKEGGEEDGTSDPDEAPRRAPRPSAAVADDGLYPPPDDDDLPF
jgi:single-strand DNA-binding protein